MRKCPYMKEDEFEEWSKVAALCGEAKAVADNTAVPEWRRKLRTAATLCSQVVDERIGHIIEPRQVLALARKHKELEVCMVRRSRQKQPPEQGFVQMSEDDANTILELALCSCLACQQGEMVKDCRFRKALHSIGCPVAKDDVDENTCEFCYK